MPHENTAKGLEQDDVTLLCLDEFLTELPSDPEATGIALEPPPRSTSVRALRPPSPSQRPSQLRERVIPNSQPRRGPSLAEVLRVREVLPLNEAADWISSLCDAVHAAHEAGLVYGNLASDVLFLERGGDHPPRLCFVDLGSSHLAYRAPEQLRTPSNVDHRADVWALGALLYELVAGRPAFVAANDLELRAKIASVDTPDLNTVRRELPLGFVATVHACLQLEPWVRVQSVADLKLMLVPFCSQRSARSASVPNEKFGTNEAVASSNERKAHQQVRYELSVQDTSVVPCVAARSNEPPQGAPITLVGHRAPITLVSERVAVAVASASVAVASASVVSARAPTFYSLLAPLAAEWERDADEPSVPVQVSRRLAPAQASPRQVALSPRPRLERRTRAGLRPMWTWGALGAATVFTAVVASVATSQWLGRAAAARPRPAPSAAHVEAIQVRADGVD